MQAPSVPPFLLLGNSREVFAHGQGVARAIRDVVDPHGAIEAKHGPLIRGVSREKSAIVLVPEEAQVVTVVPRPKLYAFISPTLGPLASQSVARAQQAGHHHGRGSAIPG